MADFAPEADGPSGYREWLLAAAEGHATSPRCPLCAGPPLHRTNKRQVICANAACGFVWQPDLSASMNVDGPHVLHVHDVTRDDIYVLGPYGGAAAAWAAAAHFAYRLGAVHDLDPDASCHIEVHFLHDGKGLTPL